MARPLGKALFYDYMRRCRKEGREIPREEYWKICPVSRFSVYNWRRRGTMPHGASIKRLAEFLNLTPRNVKESIKAQVNLERSNEEELDKYLEF